MQMESPVEQFRVHTIGNNIIVNGWDISFNNSALVMLISVALILIFAYLGLKKSSIIPSKMQVVSEMGYDFISDMVRDNIPGDKGKKFLPLIYTIFFFFLAGDAIGLIPLSFSFTAQILITLSVALLVVFITIVYGIYLHGFKIFKIFLPSGIPAFLIPYMFVLEVISFWAKGISMGVRLFANMMAGHILIEIIAGFIVALGFFGIIPLSFTVVLYAFELAICFIQAYIFAILSCIFLDQVVNLH
ncbi:MAG: F0F1 ATP synthase subunit A [Alphaproteobacteria bacterium]|jgi:F-type H+-transporting ATPase subunit a|nr:F0F1 ATP synthase subunit A [Alphaproteobacteria bacterium]